VINLSAKLFGTPRLPRIGSILAMGVLSPFALCTGKEQLLAPLLESFVSRAAQRGLEFVVLAFADNDYRLTLVRDRFRCREYRTRLYEVHWGELAEVLSNDRPCLPEVALL
jgi:hypothetical protein